MKFEDSNWVKNIKPTCSSLCSLFPMRGHRGQIGHCAARAERLRSSPAAASSVPEPSRARLLVRYAHAFALRSLSPGAVVHAVAARCHRNAASPPWSAHSCSVHAAPRPCHTGASPRSAWPYWSPPRLPLPPVGLATGENSAAMAAAP